jgi:hypothetical protein
MQPQSQLQKLEKPWRCDSKITFSDQRYQWRVVNYGCHPETRHIIMALRFISETWQI